MPKVLCGIINCKPTHVALGVGDPASNYKTNWRENDGGHSHNNKMSRKKTKKLVFFEWSTTDKKRSIYLCTVLLYIYVDWKVHVF